MLRFVFFFVMCELLLNSDNAHFEIVNAKTNVANPAITLALHFASQSFIEQVENETIFDLEKRLVETKNRLVFLVSACLLLKPFTGTGPCNDEPKQRTCANGHH